MGAGIAAAVVFVRRQRTLSDPLLDLRLFRDRALTVTLGAMLMYSMLSGGTMTFLAQHFQLVNGLSPLGAGIAMVPGMASSIVSFQLAAPLGRRIRPAFLFSGGLAVTIAGLVVISQSAGTIALAAGFAIACLGTGPLVSLGTSLVIGAVPPQRAGAAAGLAQTGNECGLPMGVALLGSAGILAYRSYLSAHPGEVARTAGQHAYTAELHVIAAIAAIALAAVAIVITLTLRRIPPLGPPQPEHVAPEQALASTAGPARRRADGASATAGTRARISPAGRGGRWRASQRRAPPSPARPERTARTARASHASSRTTYCRRSRRRTDPGRP